MEDVLQFFSQPVSLIEIVLAVVVVRPICRAIRARAGLKRLRRDEAFAPARRRRRLSPENVVAESEHLAQQPDGDQATADRHDGDTVDTYEHPDSPGGGAASDNLQLSESESESAADPSQQIESQSDQQAEHIDHEHTDHEHTDHEQPEAEQAQQADSGEGGNDSGDTSVYMLQQMSRNFAQEYNVSEDFHGWTAKLERRKDGTRTLDPVCTYFCFACLSPHTERLTVCLLCSITLHQKAVVPTDHRKKSHAVSNCSQVKSEFTHPTFHFSVLGEMGRLTDFLLS